MPIDIDRFEQGDGHDPTTGERVLRFLIDNDDRAFTRGEIADAIDADPETVGTNLTRLKDRGLVRHRRPYWAITDERDAAVRALRSRSGGSSPSPHHAAARAFFERVRSANDLADAVDDIHLFGSVARDDATATSDVDVLVVVDDDAEYAAVDDRLLDIAYDVQLDHGVPVEVHTLRASEFEERLERGEPLVRAALSEEKRDV